MIAASPLILCLLSLASVAAVHVAQSIKSPTSIDVGGWGNWKYTYELSLLPVPPEAKVEHAHGIAILDDGSILITYQDKVDPSKCLLRWNGTRTSKAPTGYQQMAEFIGPGKALCAGVPHGLRLATELVDNQSSTVLYHANNQQVLHKTDISGEMLWTVHGPPANASPNFRPTWFASDPDSPFLYLADGYGNSNIYVYDKNGAYTGHSFGGRGGEHGKFETCHAITWDWRLEQMVVCDRENHRLEYFQVNQDPSVFDYTHTLSFYPLLKRPCNIRFRHEDQIQPGDAVAIVPGLEGTVGLLDVHNNLVSLINITDVLGDQGFLHPHDAHFLPDGSGDFVLVTWNPGRIGLFRRQKSRMESNS